MEKNYEGAAMPPSRIETGSMLVFNSKSNFEDAMRMAKCLSASSIVPTAYQGDKGLPNCIIALEMANRIGASPLMVMQNLYIVHGNPGWSAKFLIAALNSSGKFSPLRYEFAGTPNTDEWQCRACAIDRSGEKLYGAWVGIAMAKKEGWYGKNGSKWQTMPELMMQYRAAAFFQRVYAPEISMGMNTEDELREIAVDTPYEDVSVRVEREAAENANKKTMGFEYSATSSPANPPSISPEKPDTAGRDERTATNGNPNKQTNIPF